MDFLPTALTGDTIVKLIGSASLLALVFGLRAVLARTLNRRVSSPELRRRWLASLRNALFLLTLLGLLSIWAETIQTFAVSVIAVAVALVIATKELTMCMLGAVVRLVGDSYAIGDRVEIGTHRGDVADHNLLTTTLLELGTGTASQQHTGRIVTLPNSVLLSTPVSKESSGTPYSLHTFVVPIRRDVDVDDQARLLLQAAKTECASFAEDVRRHWACLAKAHDIAASSPEPHVSVQMSFAEQVDLVVWIPSPTGRQAVLQEAIIRRYLQASRPTAVAGRSR